MKLFTIRNDLDPGLQAAQAVHAKELFSHEHSEVNREPSEGQASCLRAIMLTSACGTA